VRDWSPDDQLQAATSLADETETCPGCGIRPDQHHLLEAGLDRCPGCEARAKLQASLTESDRGMRIGFYPVTDSRVSVWAAFTQKGKAWAMSHRGDPALLYDPGADD